MAIELKQELRLTQQLVMTPQLQQAIKLLQLNQLELVNLVEQELQENPVLEEDEREEETSAELADATPGEEGTELRSEEAESGSQENVSENPAEPQDLAMDKDPSGEESAGGEAESGDEPSDLDKIADIEWENYMDSYPQTGLESRGGGEDEDRRSLEATLTRRPTLAEHLEWQMQLSGFGDEELHIAEWIIGNLDERGYLRCTVEEIAVQAAVDTPAVEVTLEKIQRLDPAGVAARDLRECLMLQIRALGIEDPLVVRIVDEHLDRLQKRDFRSLTRLLDASIGDVAAAAHVIGSLEPRPGRAFGGEDPIYITPDIYVYKVGDEFHVLLNEDGLPKLRINNVYKDVLARGRATSATAKDTKSYVQDKVRSAVWLIKSIHQRQRTIYKVMQSIIKQQREFFDKGVTCLKPLNLRDVADDIEMHESTVSRVTTNKYAHTPQGIFELKYFFNSSIGCFEGDAVASESVKEKIRKIIANEDPVRPMSDQRIAEMLKTANIDIARRTVTKYREAMNILSSTKRRQVG